MENGNRKEENNMKKINWKLRKENIAFWIGLLGVIVSPVLAYTGASLSDFTTWESVADAIVSTVQNPYLVGSIISAVLGFLGVTADPTTKGLADSKRALERTACAPNCNHIDE